ncbi:MAG: T9SS type A sorting domain-containing protein [Candidatus Kapaibacterium sp.]
MKVVREYQFFKGKRGLGASIGVILISLIFSTPSFAQGSGKDEINPQTTSNGGEIQQGEFGSMFSTIGEPVAADSMVAGAVDGEATWIGFWQIMPSDTTSGVREEWTTGGAGESGLTSAAPNPFHDEITVYIRLAAPGNVKLTAYDMIGREAQVLIDGHREAGTSRVYWQPEGIETGTYLLRLEIDGTEYPTTTIQYVQ